MKNLRCKYRIGRPKRIVQVTATKDKVSYIYETLVVTDHGNYSEKEWFELVEKQAKELFEENILELLKQHSLKELAWINTDEEAYKYALELYASRIWENEFWVGYDEFNMQLHKKEHVEQISLI